LKHETLLMFIYVCRIACRWGGATEGRHHITFLNGQSVWKVYFEKNCLGNWIAITNNLSQKRVFTHSGSLGTSSRIFGSYRSCLGIAVYGRQKFTHR
jgi:hypothetical protein